MSTHALIAGTSISLIGVWGTWKAFTSKPRQIDEDDQYTVYIVDDDKEGSSVLSQLVTSSNGALSKPRAFCEVLDRIPDDKVLRVVINTDGGALSNCEKILKRLAKRKNGYVAYIRETAYSAGALIALGAKEIVMNSDSYIGKIDPQSGETKRRQLSIWAKMPEEYVDASNKYAVTEAQFVINYTERLLEYVQKSTGLDEADQAKLMNKIREHLLWSELPHEALFNVEFCRKEIGLQVREPTPAEAPLFETKGVTIRNFQRV